MIARNTLHTAAGRTSIWLASASALAMTSPAVAQSNELTASPVSAETPADTAEIIVTAQRREEKLSDVGMSITAIGADALTKRNIVQVSDLAKLVPGLSVSDSGFSTPIYTLRGVGVNEPSIGSSSSVAIYIDEVPLAFPILTQGATLDLQRVEVLKGPQGTLYGQNSTGGAINYIANKPTDDFAAGVSGTIGRFTRGNVEGFVSGPITSTLKARVAARYNFGDGWQRSLSRDDSLGKIKNFTGRAIVDWEATSKLKFSFNANGWTDDSDTLAPQLVKVFPSSSLNVSRDLVVVDTANPASCSSPVNRVPGCPINAATGSRVTAANQEVITRPELLPGNSARQTDWDAGQDFSRRDRFYQVSGRAEWELTDDLSLISITSFAHLTRTQNSEGDGTAVPVLRSLQGGTIKSFAQEARLAGDFSGIHLVVGANLGRDTTSDNVAQTLIASSQLRNVFGFPANGSSLRAHQNIHNWAVFGSVDVPITSQLTLTGGVRYSEDDRKFRGCGFVFDAGSSAAFTAVVNAFRGAAGLPLIPAIPAGACSSVYTTAAGQSLDTAGLPVFTPGLAHQELKENNIPWNVNLDFKPTARSLIYARVSRGYKSGNFSSLNAPDLAGYRALPQEELTAYELGGRLSVGRTLRLEAAIFRYDYIDKQLRARIAVGPPFGNINGQDTIPKSRIKGAEGTVVLAPLKGLTLTGSATYIDSKILRYVGQTVDGVLQDEAGSPFNFTPKYSFNGDLDYSHPISSSLNAFGGVNVAYRGKTSAIFVPPNANTTFLAPFSINKYTLVDAQLGIESPSNGWRAFVWGKNVFNKYYWTNAIRNADVIVRYPGMPATYGITISKKF